MNRRSLELGLVAFIVIVAALLRLADLDLMEFKADEAGQIALALPTFDSPAQWPQAGIVNSAGVHNSPLFTQLVALVMRVGTRPTTITAVLVGVPAVIAVLLTYWVLRRRFSAFVSIATTAAYGFSLWPVLYARKLWMQSLLPIFAILFFELLFSFGRTRVRAAAVPLLLLILCHLHPTAITLVVPVAVVIILSKRSGRPVHGVALVVGVILGLATWAPYISFQARHHFEELRENRSPLAKFKPPYQGVRAAVDPLIQTLTQISPDPEYALGRSIRDYEAMENPWFGLFRSGSTICWAVFMVAGIAIALLGFGKPQNAELWCAALASLVLVSHWLAGAITTVSGRWIFPHYFIVLYPLPFLMAVFGIEQIVAYLQLRREIALPIASGLLAAQLGALATFRGLLREKGGAAGDYGVCYVHKAELAAWLDKNHITPKDELGVLISLRQRWPQGIDTSVPPLPTGTEIRVTNLLDQKYDCVNRILFGPLQVCVVGQKEMRP